MSQNRLKSLFIKERISERLFVSTIIFLFVLAILVFDQKFGIRSAGGNSWFEVYEDLPFLILASAFISLGFFFATSSVIGKNLVICSNCQKTYPKNKVHDLICPECGNQLEPLVGFYDRNPHLRNTEAEEK